MFTTLRHLLQLIRFSHTIFALPFALLAVVMAWCVPTPDGGHLQLGWPPLLGILLCMVFARSAAMAFNRLVDRHIDAGNPRTEKRHLPAGLLSVGSVVGFTIACSLGFVASTALFLPNVLPLILSLPVLLLLCGYSYTKRFTSLAHVWLGFALMLAPICAWIALRGEFLLANPGDLLPAVLLGVVVLLWVSGFDMIYACQDFEFDQQTELHSIPTRFGIQGALRIAAACHALMILGLIALGWVCGNTLGLGLVYWCSVLAVAALLAYEHWIVRPDDLTRVNIAFFNVNALVSIGLFLACSVDLLIT